MDWRILVNFIRQSMLKLPTHSDFHDLFLNYSTWIIYFPVAVALLYHVMQFYNSTLADLETSYHLLTSIYYKNSLNLTISLVTKYYP
jgi:hypothetical protein